ncbi:MAG: toprim domain-containing protein [Bacillota bacterium]
MKIRGRDVKVDVRYELSQFKWNQSNWTDDGMKLICCSPFRPDDSRPSFFVRLKSEGPYEAGIWSDSGGIDNDWQKGGFVKLYSFLHDVDIETAEDMLLEAYHSERKELVWRPPSFNLKKVKKFLPDSFLFSYKDDNIYLQNRNIRSEIVDRFGVGYSKETNCIAIPWRTAGGKLANVKYRKASKKEKLFWYAPNGVPIRELIWGLDEIYKNRTTTAVLCESEIDALQSYSFGVPAIAIGGGAFSTDRAEKIIRSPIEHIVIATDNDDVGRRIRKAVESKLEHYMKISHLYIPNPYKDINDVPAKEEFQFLFDKAVNKPRKFSFKKSS